MKNKNLRLTEPLQNSFWQKNRKKILLLGLLTLVALVVSPNLTFAQGVPALASSGQLDEIYKTIATFLTVILEFLQRILWPILLLIGGLMKNDILFEAGMEDLMINIWANIRNVVNILFVLVLLGIAFYNVMGLGQNYHIKTILPKFVIALIAVNFSYLAVKVVIDSVNVVSIAIFAMPNMVQQGTDQQPIGKEPFSTDEKQSEVCQGFYGKEPGKYQAAITAAGESALCTKEFPGGFTDKARNFFASFDANNAGIVMAVNLSKIAKLDQVNVTEATVKNLALNMLFSVTFYVVYATAFVALFVVLLARLVVLWITIVLSPLAVLPYVLPEKLKSSLGEAGKLQEEFVKHAIVPIPIALVMTIGFIMLEGLQKSQFKNLSLLSSTSSVDFLTSGLSTLQEIIVAIGMVGVVWTGVFAAAGNTLAKGVTEALKSGVGGAGKFLATSWKYAPIFPVTTGAGKQEKVSLAGALGVARQLPREFEDKSMRETGRLMKGLVGADVYAAINEMKESKNAKGFMQSAVNAGMGAPKDTDFQKNMGDILNKNKRWHGDLEWKGLTKDGKSITAEQFLKDLQAGTAEPEAVEHFIRQNQQKFNIQREEPSAKKPETTSGTEAAATTAPAIGATAAKEVLDYAKAGAYEAGLHPDKKKALDNYRNAVKTGKDQEKALQGAQGALQELRDLENQGGQFLSNVPRVQNAEELDKMIASRRDELQKLGIIGDPADAILRVELEPLREKAGKGDATAQAIIDQSKPGTISGQPTKSASEILKLTPPGGSSSGTAGSTAPPAPPAGGTPPVPPTGTPPAAH